MPQRLKQEVRERIVAAAAAIFADQGYAIAKLSDVAERAETSTSNIYKYFANKEALFDEIVTPALAGQLLKLLRTRIRELGQLDSWTSADAAGSDHARALLSFWVEHRHVTLVLLRGAEGTRFTHFRDLIAREMERLAADYISRTRGEQALSPELAFVLHKLFVRTVDMLADILTEYDKPAAIQQAFAHFWRYQLAGLQALLTLQSAPQPGPPISSTTSRAPD
ncbi:TetR/AcrR family transcriptional regulator [Rhizobium sp. KVB221]|uniref:TetR/AcrR family transcriptional regulator n=1 Tax=Rhizobium setariae TaxID=2801340 RepID=A0A937CJ96_9HYPH|nr:TetR/AcrR family transcriptional regulator [Rhizobium setariae]MBL0370880.1 TetR/AcrR family transcriptional regulator [Rhizobium setariae]